MIHPVVCKHFCRFSFRTYFLNNSLIILMEKVTTPTKSKDSNFSQSLTPVRFLDSPKIKSGSTDSNVAACKSRLEIIVKTIEDNFNKWQLAEKRGQALCSSIEAIKTKALERLDSDKNSFDSTTSYPDELKMYCDKLAIIASIFQDITKNAMESLRQLKALSKLPGSCTEIYYRSWQLSEFINFLIELFERYEKEAKVKAHVAEHLAHYTTRSDLIRCSTAWEYPQHVDDYVKLMFLFFKEEINSKNKPT